MKPASSRPRRPARLPSALAATIPLALATCGDPLPPIEVDDSTQTITHAFGALTLPAQSDNAQRCVSWRLENEAALYVQSVRLANEGSFHHSNWIVVPEDAYPGPDGYWDCPDRNFEEVAAAQQGTVLFAQSTQSYDETQNLSAGAVIKIPPHHKIVGLLHTLNTAPREASSGLWLTLELLHPSAVKTIVTPMTMQYHDLQIPGNQESRFTGACDLSVAHGLVSLQPLDLKLHYLLPHYHYLGNYFDVSVIGGKHDGESIFRMTGFNGEGNGRAFDPPLALSGATGLRLTCGYDNWRGETIRWGNGEGEMCVLLALVESDAVLGASVDTYTHLVGVKDDVHFFEGACLSGALLKKANQGPPTAAERRAPLYVPPIDPDDAMLPPHPECRDVDPTIAGDSPATLGSIRNTIFTPSCSFSACHGEAAAGGLDLGAPDLHERLLGNSALGSDLPLVTPGDPDNSWLYHLLSRCDPDGAAHMPRNAPFLLDPALVNKVRAWIADGAKDN